MKKILECYDLAVIAFLHALARIGSGFVNLPMYEPIAKEHLSKWEMQIARTMLGSFFILISFAVLYLITQVL